MQHIVIGRSPAIRCQGAPGSAARACRPSPTCGRPALGGRKWGPGDQVAARRPTSHIMRVAMPSMKEGTPWRGPADEFEYRPPTVLDSLVLQMFREKLVEEVGMDSDKPGYAGVIELAHVLNSKPDMRQASLRIYENLFVNLRGFLGFFPKVYNVAPGFASMTVAIVCAYGTEWLVGPSEMVDVEKPDGTIAKNAGVKVTRCRYLAESGCASVCVNTCKAPAQQFFKDVMDLDVTITPNYDDFSCEFRFGEVPPLESEDPAFQTPCFEQCPTKSRHRRRHPELSDDCPVSDNLLPPMPTYLRDDFP